jgi:hypothetical protein
VIYLCNVLLNPLLFHGFLLVLEKSWLLVLIVWLVLVIGCLLFCCSIGGIGLGFVGGVVLTNYVQLCCWVGSGSWIYNPIGLFSFLVGWLGVFEILIIIWISMLMNSFWMQYKGGFYG